MFSSDKNIEIARKVYSTPEGRALLTDLLNNLGFFRMDLDNDRDILLENKAKELLYELGIWRPHNVGRIVDALLDMPYMEGTK